MLRKNNVQNEKSELLKTFLIKEKFNLKEGLKRINESIFDEYIKTE